MKIGVLSRAVTATLAAACLATAAGAAQAQGIYAPFVYLPMTPVPLIDQIGVQQGIQQFNLAFVVAGSGCQPSWGGVQPIGANASGSLLSTIATSIANFRAKGGEVAVSFGGAAGTPLMQACSSVSTLKSAYQTVINTYNLTHVDFDLEGSPLQDTAAVSRHFRALAQLQSSLASKGKTLHVTLTLPAMPYGLTSDAVNAVNVAIQNKVTFDAVNLMTMDYGTADTDMGAAAVSAAQGLYSQLDTAYKAVGQVKTNAQLWQMVGVTPMIGVNDTPGEIFTVANAQSVLNVASTNGYGLLSNWSISRDQSCPNGGTQVSLSCSGITQNPYDFATVFKPFNGHWGTGVTQDPNY